MPKQKPKKKREPAAGPAPGKESNAGSYHAGSPPVDREGNRLPFHQAQREYRRRRFLLQWGGRLSVAAEHVINSILENANFREYRDTGRLIAWPSNATMAGRVRPDHAHGRHGLPARFHTETIRRSVRRLESGGVIRVLKVGGGRPGSPRTANTIELIWPPDPDQPTPRAGAGGEPARARGEPPRQRGDSPRAGAGVTVFDGTQKIKSGGDGTSRPVAAAVVVELSEAQKKCLEVLAGSREFTAEYAEQVIREPEYAAHADAGPSGRLQRIVDECHRLGTTVQTPVKWIKYMWRERKDFPPQLFHGPDFDPFRSDRPADGRAPEHRIADAVRAGQINVVYLDDSPRQIVSCKYSNNLLSLTVKATPDAAEERLPPIQTKDLHKWRFSHVAESRGPVTRYMSAVDRARELTREYLQRISDEE